MTRLTVRVEVLDPDLQQTGELHPAELGGVTCDRGTRTLDGLVLDPTDAAKVTPGRSWLRPVYILGSTEHVTGTFLYTGGPEVERPGGWWVTAPALPDRTFVLDQGMREPFPVDEDDVLTDAAEALFNDAGIPSDQLDIVPSPRVAGTPLVFDQARRAGLDQIAFLLGYLPPHFDSTGRGQFRPVPVPADEPIDHQYVTAGKGPTAKIHPNTLQRTRNGGLRPNVYRIRSTVPTSVVIARTLEVPATEPHSFASTGFEVVRDLPGDGIENTEQADAALQAAYQTDRNGGLTVTWTSDPQPHEAFQIVAVDSDALLEHQWTLPFDGSGMTHTATSVYVDA